MSLDSLQDPEYTGPNRCNPCTVTNLAIAAVLAIGVGIYSPVVGCGVLIISATAIWARGYLIPGTPQLTKRYFPPWLLNRFGKSPEPTPGRDSETDASFEGSEIETTLVESGILEDCDQGNDLCLNEAVERHWRTLLDNTDNSTLYDCSAITGIPESDLSLDFSSEQVKLREGIKTIGKWPSKAALLADITASKVLREEMNQWEHLSRADREVLLTAMRLFVPQCPTTGNAIEFSDEVTESCCSTHDVVAITCTKSGDVILEQPV